MRGRVSRCLEIVRVVRKVSNIAALDRSSTWTWRFVPPWALGSNSFSPRFGMTGRAAPGL